MCFAFIIFYLTYHGYYIFHNYINKRTLINRKESPYFTKQGSINHDNIILIVVRSLFALLSLNIMYYIQESALTSGVNSSVILSILSGTAFITALAFYVVY
jgi:hypothetical protein